MMLSKTLKGFRDFLPEESILRNKIIDKIKNVFELYGFDPLETPALEYQETLLNKYGQEADKLIYLFQDRGGRKVGLKYDQTVPLARIIAQYQNLTKPFKRYQIQPVWRAENTQKGRYREFLQCDIDIVGSQSVYYDVEIIECAIATINALGFKNTKVLLNDRQVFSGLDSTYILTIDKLSKIGQEKVVEELVKKGLKKDEAETVLEKIRSEKPTERLEKIFSILAKKGLKKDKDFVFQPTLARGLDYYTSTIFELVSDDYSAGSLGGGGRYDNLIGKFLGKDSIPAVGFAFGFDRLVEAIKELNLFSTNKTKTKILVTVFSEAYFDKSLAILDLLRKNNLAAEILYDLSKLDKQLKYADKKGIPYVIILGPEEEEKGLYKLKNMKTGEQKQLEINELIKFLNQLT